MYDRGKLPSFLFGFFKKMFFTLDKYIIEIEVRRGLIRLRLSTQAYLNNVNLINVMLLRFVRFTSQCSVVVLKPILIGIPFA